MQNPSPHSPFSTEDVPPSQLFPSFVSPASSPPPTDALFSPPLFPNCFARTLNTITPKQLGSEVSFSSAYYLLSFSSIFLLFIFLLSFWLTIDQKERYFFPFILLSSLAIILILFGVYFCLFHTKSLNTANEYQFYPTFFTVLSHFPFQSQRNIAYQDIKKVTETKNNIYLHIQKSVGSPNKNYYEFSKSSFSLGDSQLILYYLATSYPKIKYKQNTTAH